MNEQRESIRRAAFIGVGAIVGAGIFALLGAALFPLQLLFGRFFVASPWSSASSSTSRTRASCSGLGVGRGPRSSLSGAGLAR
jgi:hypothetical protein